MSSVLAPRPDDRPPQSEDWGTGVTISIVAHLTLIGALVWGLHWKSSPDAIPASAELWAAVPEAAAAPPVEAPPPPPVVQAPVPAPPPPVEAPKPPDIVVEKVPEKKKPEKPKPEPPPKPAKVEPTPAPPPPPKDKLDAKQLAKLHDENVKRMLGQMNAPTDAVGTAARTAGPSANYWGRVIAQLKRNMVLTDSISGNPGVEVEIHCAADGTIISRRITHSSGSQAWDDAVIRAIDRTGTLPRDTDGKTPSTIPIFWHPQD
ncbi:MAG: energy transducer TonB [Betaproteobacteria bacterium]